MGRICIGYGSRVVPYSVPWAFGPGTCSLRRSYHRLHVFPGSRNQCSRSGRVYYCRWPNTVFRRIEQPVFWSDDANWLVFLGIIIPGGADVKFGYYVTDSDSGYPLAADNGPMAPMGGYAGSDIASLTDTWKDLYDIDVNIQISAMAGPTTSSLPWGITWSRIQAERTRKEIPLPCNWTMILLWKVERPEL